MAIDDLKNKRRNQGGQGSSGTTLGSPDGFGVKKRYSKPQDNPVIGGLISVGNRLASDFIKGASTIGRSLSEKGVVGGIKDTLKYNAPYIKEDFDTLKSFPGRILFGKEYNKSLESSKTLDDITSSKQPIKIEASTPNIPQPLTSSLGNVNLTQSPQGQLSIDLGNNRGGGLGFKDARTLDQKQLDSLASRIAFNNSPEGQASFAKNTQLSNQRDQEYLDQIRLKNLAEQELFNRAAQYSVDQSNLANLGPSLREQTNEGVIRGRADSLLRKRGFGRSGTALLESTEQPSVLREQQRQSLLSGISNREQLASQNEQTQAELNRQYQSRLANQQRFELEKRRILGSEFIEAEKLNVAQQKAASEEARTRLGGVLDLIKSGQLSINQGAAIFKNQGGSLNIDTASIFLPDKVAKELSSIPTPKDKLNFLGDYFSKDIAEEIINNSYK